MPHLRMQTLIQTAPMLRCPLCGGSLHEAGTALACETGHAFSLSSRGYADFVPGKQGGMYDVTLFEARQRVLNGPFYDPMLEQTRALMEKYAPSGPVLDAGCGEGTFLKRLCPQRRPALGIDLSRAGIRLAAKGGNDYGWLTADLTRLPIKDGTVNCLLNILSPAEYPEFTRVLEPKGILIKVIPGEHYLQELRGLAREQLQKDTYSNRAVMERFESRFKLLEQREVEACFPLPEEIREDFIRMTPLMHHVDRSRLDIQALEHITIHLHILCGWPEK